MSEIEAIKKHLDAVAGSQLAVVTATKLLLTSYQGNAQAMQALEEEFERMRSTVLYSQASDYKIHAFDEAAESLLETLKPKATQ
jgi:type VI protein secretion system component VasK